MDTLQLPKKILLELGQIIVRELCYSETEKSIPVIIEISYNKVIIYPEEKNKDFQLKIFAVLKFFDKNIEPTILATNTNDIPRIIIQGHYDGCPVVIEVLSRKPNE